MTTDEARIGQTVFFVSDEYDGTLPNGFPDVAQYKETSK